MNQCCYDEAVQIGLHAMRQLEYSDSCCSAFRIATREFKEYMERGNLQYSPQLPQQWINDTKEHWKTHKLKASRKAMNILTDIIEHGNVTKSLQTKMDRTPLYTRLPNWSKTILDKYLATIHGVYGAPYLSQIRNACARFFSYLEFAGITQPSDITHEQVKTFFHHNIHASSTAKDRSDNEVRHCLLYMANEGAISETVGLALNKFVIPDLVIVAQLPEPERNRFAHFFNASMEDLSRSKADFDAAVGQLVNRQVSLHYSKFIQNATIQVTRDFSVFMEANSFAYTNELAMEWLEFQGERWPRTKYLYFRRILLSVDEMVCTGGLSTRIFSLRSPKYTLPPWGDDLLSQYLREREREGCTASTLDMIKNSCARFIVFLDHHDVASEKGITPEWVKAFQLQDHHRTVAGKNAYAIKIRGFLRFLAREGLVPKTLEMALSTEMAPHSSIVTTLSNDQIEAIYTFRQQVNQPMGLRNAAIVLLGLRMGLRASDIANLKLADISWKEGSLSFTQQKTGVHVKLPLPVDVGNSLYRYLCEGRPPSHSPYVFLHHRAPFCRFQRGHFGRILEVVIAEQGKNERIHGFHVTRKTYASKLLARGTPVGTIAAALGHVGVHTVDEYLATEEDQMRLCAIGLQGIEYSGRFSL